MVNLALEVIEGYERAQADATRWYPLFEDIRTYIYPVAAGFSNKNGSGDDGFNRNRKIFDPTAERAHADLASALTAGVTNPIDDWFAYGVVSLRKQRQLDNKQWLESLTRQVLSVLQNPSSNFYPAMHSGYYGITGFGTDIIYKRGRGTKSYYQAIPLSDLLFEENDRGRVDCVYRLLRLTYRQAMQLFPKASSSALMYFNNYKLESRSSNRIDIVHMVRESLPGEKGKRVKSVYVLKENNEVLEVSGFDRMPFYVGRWEVIHGREVFGRCPSMRALKDAKALNEMVKTNLSAGQKVVEPPMQAPNNAYVNKLNLSSKALNLYEAVVGLPDPTAKPLITVGNLPIGLEMENQRRNAIKESFFIDTLQEDKRARMTALEVAQSAQDRLGKMTPQLARLQSELITPILQDLAREIEEEGILDKRPGDLEGEDIFPSYTGPLARAQRQTSALSVQRFLNGLSAVGQIMPEVLLAPNARELVEYLREAEGVPAHVMKTPEEFESAIIELQNQQRKQQEIESANQLITAGQGLADIQNKGGDLNALFA